MIAGSVASVKLSHETLCQLASGAIIERMTVAAPHNLLPQRTTRTVGCVSFLNAKPLIDSLETSLDPRVLFAVPSALLSGLQTGETDIALCPVIDFQRTTVPLDVVPVGCIGCDGITLTVRLFSQVPIASITTLHADTDSHTSVALACVLLKELTGHRPDVIDYHAPPAARYAEPEHRPTSLLLIGDKVVTDSPPAALYPYQLDLGEAWKKLTGEPFVFAIWMSRHGAELGDLPALLNRTRIANASRIDEIAAHHAPLHGWPVDVAQKYLGHWLRYDVGPRQLAAMEHFWALAAQAGLIESAKPMSIH